MSADALGPPLVSVYVVGHGPSLNQALRGNRHVHQRLHHRVRDDAVWALKAQGVRPLRLRRALVRVTVVWPTRRHADYDGAVQRSKAAVDSLKLAGIIQDDGPDYLTWVEVRQETVKGQRGVKLEVWAKESQG